MRTLFFFFSLHAASLLSKKNNGLTHQFDGDEKKYLSSLFFPISAETVNVTVKKKKNDTKAAEHYNSLLWRVSGLWRWGNKNDKKKKKTLQQSQEATAPCLCLLLFKPSILYKCIKFLIHNKVNTLKYEFDNSGAVHVSAFSAEEQWKAERNTTLSPFSAVIILAFWA